ncbi:hypothetical protein Taro_016312 [Colocasia esculenta]|uniref:Uncharacterized protein n=1 Tax=Colocasia esculenta TaxID=4460 RepID=A0A843UNG7_COLES|nr:hypothetical protein [Colocasia esculenta]
MVAWDTEDGRSSTRCRLVSPLSHCLSLCWFQSHVVVLGVRPQLGQAAVLRVLYSVAALSRPCAGAEAGARLASRARGLRVPLLATSGGGLVAIVVTMLPHDISNLHGNYSLVVPSSRGRRWSGLVRTYASGGFRSVFSRFRSPVLGYQSVVAPASVVSRPGGVSRVRGGSACGPSTSWRSEVVVLEFPIFGVHAALAGEGLVIPNGPCSRGSPPYFLHLGARRRGSSASDGLQRRLWRHVLSAAMRASVVSSCSRGTSVDTT